MIEISSKCANKIVGQLGGIYRGIERIRVEFLACLVTETGLVIACDCEHFPLAPPATSTAFVLVFYDITFRCF